MAVKKRQKKENASTSMPRRIQRVGPPSARAAAPSPPPADPCVVRAAAFFGTDGAGIEYSDLDQFVPVVGDVSLSLGNPSSSDRSEVWTVAVVAPPAACFISTPVLNPGPTVLQTAWSQTLGSEGNQGMDVVFPSPTRSDTVVLGAARSPIDGNALDEVVFAAVASGSTGAVTQVLRDTGGAVNEQVNQFVFPASPGGDTTYHVAWFNTPNPLPVNGDFRWAVLAEIYKADGPIAPVETAADFANPPGAGTDNVTTPEAPAATNGVLILGLGDLEEDGVESSPDAGTGFSPLLSFVDFGFGPPNFALLETKNDLDAGEYAAVFSATEPGTHFVFSWVIT